MYQDLKQVILAKVSYILMQSFFWKCTSGTLIFNILCFIVYVLQISPYNFGSINPLYE